MQMIKNLKKIFKNIIRKYIWRQSNVTLLHRISHHAWLLTIKLLLPGLHLYAPLLHRHIHTKICKNITHCIIIRGQGKWSGLFSAIYLIHVGMKQLGVFYTIVKILSIYSIKNFYGWHPRAEKIATIYALSCIIHFKITTIWNKIKLSP